MTEPRQVYLYEDTAAGADLMAWFINPITYLEPFGIAADTTCTPAS